MYKLCLITLEMKNIIGIRVLGNERTDELVRQGAEELLIGPPSLVSLEFWPEMSVSGCQKAKSIFPRSKVHVAAR